MRLIICSVTLIGMEKGKITDFFRREDVMVLITTSPAGLGHVRVTEALIRGLPEGVRAEILGIEDKRIQFLHRISSINRSLRRIVEFMQNNSFFEGLYVSLYRTLIRRDTGEIYLTISNLVRRRRPKPKVLLIISTHFSLAHKIAEVKIKLAKELNLCVVFCVVVTDDSPQKIWGVYGADYIVVPSQETRFKLIEYFNSLNVLLPNILVSAYPISPIFSALLDETELKTRKKQLKKLGGGKMKIIIPISGAAVQLSYFKDLVNYLNRKKRADVTIISRDSEYTKEFLAWCQAVPSVAVVADKFDKDVVLSYEKEIENNIFSIEITKPSEQTFKALCRPDQKGGVILLFSQPVGRQENDNLRFLTKHGLLPNDSDRTALERLFYSNNKDGIDTGLLERASRWRGLILPPRGDIAGRAILRLRKTGVLDSMVNFDGFPESKELRSNGVKVFWRKISRRTRNQCSFLT